jgi:hypothetical protein
VPAADHDRRGKFAVVDFIGTRAGTNAFPRLKNRSKEPQHNHAVVSMARNRLYNTSPDRAKSAQIGREFDKHVNLVLFS